MSTKRGATTPNKEDGRQKKYHRRAVWACDECRLRKIKCDGNEPCSRCVAFTHECSYEGRSRPPLAPTKRIRVLEETLRNVRKSILNLKDGSDQNHSAEINRMLDLLDPQSLTDDKSDKIESRPESQNGSTVTPQEHAMLQLPGIDLASSSVFFGPVSGFSIIRRMSELFNSTPGLDHRAFQSQQSATELFCSHESRSNLQQFETVVSLPLPEELIELYRASFGRHYLLYQVVSEHSLVSMIEDIGKGIINPSTEPLLHAIVALGLVSKSSTHRHSRCLDIRVSSARHYEAALNQLDFSRCEGLRSLQTVLCLVLYLVSCSNLTAAHTYSCIACSWLLQLGLHRKPPAHAPVNISKNKEILILTLKLHLCLCAILDLPPALQRRQIDSGIWASVQSQFDPTALSDDMDRSSSRLDSPSSCHFLLLEITKEGLDRTFSNPTYDMSVSTDELSEAVDLGQLGSVEGRLQELTERASKSTLSMTDRQSQAIAKAELEMTTCFCQLMMYMPFLHHTASMANGSSTSRTRSQRVLACLKVASKTINLCTALLDDDLLEPASWLQTYTLFLAVLALVFLIAAHKGTTQPSEAWRKAEQGIRVLAALQCHENGATRCLRVIRALVSQLSHTVEFDIDTIERNAVRVCQSSGHHQTTAMEMHNMIDPNLHGSEFTDARSAGFEELQSTSADSLLARANEFVLFGNGD